MKPCTGCIYLSTIYDECTYYKKDKVSSQYTGNIKGRSTIYTSLKVMRENENKCGLDRKFYASKIKVGFQVMLFIIIMVITTGFFLYGLVNMLDSIGR